MGKKKELTIEQNIDEQIVEQQAADEPVETQQVLDDAPAQELELVEQEAVVAENDLETPASEEANDEQAVDVSENASEDAAQEPVGKAKRKRRKIYEFDLHKDIRYRGPFSYRWLRIFAWVSIVAAQVALILSLGIKIDANLAKNFTGFAGFLQIVGTLSVPLFLMANFALIINAKNGYKRLIAAYAFMSLVIFSLFMLIYQRYLLGIMKMLTEGSDKSPQEYFQMVFSAFSTSGFLSFNIFIDLFLCTLFTFFVNYNPKKVFVGKKIIIFRLFALLPVAYEIVSFTLKTLCVLKDGFTLPLYVAPFLTTKPPLTFVVFIVLAFFIKGRERMFLKRGRTDEEYGVFLKTNLNSLHFSIAASVCMIVAAILDIILFLIVGVALIPDGTAEEVLAQAYLTGLQMANELGFGKSIPLLLVVPFIMLFSYTRTHAPSAIDMIIPNIGIVAFAICYVEGLYQFILRLPALIGGMIGG
ncbi:MAG: hypothetical protein II867_00800 [Clostridia bacterium]|nr:hypothetical protein [Clostridia bacterium]